MPSPSNPSAFSFRRAALSAACLLACLTGLPAHAQTAQYVYRSGVPGLSVADTPPAASLTAETSAQALSFDPVELGQQAEKTVLFSSTGTGALTLSAPQTTGSAFSAVSSCVSPLAPGQSCLATVTFAPTSRGQHTGVLSFGSNAVSAPHLVALQGVGLEAAGSLSPTSVAFSDVEVGQSASRSLVFTNTGDLAISTYAAVAGSGLSLLSNTCGTQAAAVVLSAGASCDLTVRFAPTGAGELSGASVQVRRASTTLASAPVTGRAVPPPGLGVFTDSVSNAFGGVNVGTAYQKTVVFTNTGGSVLAGVSASMSGASYSLGTNGCGTPQAPISLAAGESCNVTVQVLASAMGDTSGVLTLSSAGANSPLNRTFTASGQQAVGELTAQTSTSFGEVSVNSSVARSFTFRNVGNASLLYPSVTVNNARLAISGNTCTAGSTIAPNGTCTFTVTYTPNAVATLTDAYVRVDSNNAANKPSQLTLTGSGVTRTATLTAATSNNFGVVSIGASATLDYTYRNTGTATISDIVPSVSGSALSIDSTTCGTAQAPGTLAGGATCTIRVRFTPTTGGASSGSLSVASNASATALSAALSGTGGSVFFISVNEGSSWSPNAGAGKLFRSVQFASYGTPTGTGPNYVTGACHASNSASVVSTTFLNKQTATISASNSTFGDPCSGTPKRLAIVLVAY